MKRGNRLQEFRTAENNYNYLTEMQKLNQEILKRDSVSTESSQNRGSNPMRVRKMHKK